MPTIAQRFEYFLSIRGINKSTFAKQAGVSRQYLSNITNTVMAKYSDLLYDAGCNLSWLFTGKGEPFADNESGEYLRNMAHAKIHYERSLLASESIPNMDSSDIDYNRMVTNIKDLKGDLRNIKISGVAAATHPDDLKTTKKT